MKTLLLGMGNPILTDDAVGIRLAVDLARRVDGRPGLDVVEECSVGGLNLLDVFTGYDRVVVLDSICTTEGTPGAWHHFTAEALRDTVHLTNVHDVNFATALELGRRLGMPLPEPTDIHIFAVEVEDNLTFSRQLTPALEEAYPAMAAAIFGEVTALLGASTAETRS